MDGWASGSGWNPETEGAFVDIYSLLKPLSPQAIYKIIIYLERWAKLKEDEEILCRPMNEKEIQDSAEGSLFQIGAHTHHHSNLSRQPATVQRKEIVRSKQRLESITHSAIKYFSYPYGTKDSYTPLVIRILRYCDFKTACSAFPGVVFCDSNTYELPRCNILDWNLAELKRAIRRFFSLG